MHERKILSLRSCQLLSSLAAVVILMAPLRLSAQTTLKLLADPSPEDATIYIPSDIRGDVKIYAEITGKWKQLNWKFSGPGSFRNTEFGALYTLPEHLKESPAYVLLTATLISNKGQVLTKHLKWTLMDPPPTPTPSPPPTSTPSPTPTPTMTPTVTPAPSMTPTRKPEQEPLATRSSIHSMTSSPKPKDIPLVTPSPTPEPTATPTVTPSPIPEPTATPTVTPSPSPEPTATPTVTPSPIPEPSVAPNSIPKAPPAAEKPTPVPLLSDLEQHLNAAKRYFNKKSYTTPDGKNAFDEYKAALRLDPTNRKAKQGMYEILRKYEFWGDDEYKKGNFNNARKAYERYLMVADYLIEIFQDKTLEQDAQTITERMQ